MRKCEKCHGPGPCLYDNVGYRYVCRGCHSNPEDAFFKRKHPPRRTEAGTRMTKLVCVGFYQTGIDSGQIGYSVAFARVADLSDEQFAKLKDELANASASMTRIREAGGSNQELTAATTTLTF